MPSSKKKSASEPASGSSARLRRIRMVIFDIDGVMTDGRIIYGSDGTEYKVFHAHDGYGITRGHEHGLLFGAISGRSSKVTELRMKRLGVTDVYQNAMDKVGACRRIMKKHRLAFDEICFIGDDEFDIDLLRKVGFSAAPCDAIGKVTREVNYVTRREGGRGAVREIIDMVLRAKRLIE